MSHTFAVTPSAGWRVERRHGTPKARVAVRSARLAHPRDEWQCVSHCHSVSNASNRHALGASGSAIGAAGTPKGRVAVRLTLPLGGERTGRNVEGRVEVRSARLAHPRDEWQCVSHCHSVSNASNRNALEASGSVPGTSRDEWQCVSHCHSAVNVRGGTLRGEWQCESVHPSPSGSATGAPRGEWKCERRRCRPYRRWPSRGL